MWPRAPLHGRARAAYNGGDNSHERVTSLQVLLINGSPHARGCTYTALAEVAGALHAEGIRTHLLHVGARPISGCMGCGGCAGTHRCVFADDPVNEAIALAGQCDGFVFGSPVHYAAASGAITAFMDRMFYAGSAVMRGKPAAAVVSARRAGTTAAIDQLNKYFMISGMPIAASQYWPMVHGSTPEQVMQDEEGLQTMRQLGRCLAWMIRSFAIARERGVLPPAPEAERKRTNFIR